MTHTEQNNLKRYNLNDIAKLAGVAPSTVSRVLNGKTTKVKVSEETQTKIRQLVKKLNYTPNINARRLWTSRSNTIGLAVPVEWQVAGGSIFSDHPFTEMLCGIERALSETQYRLMLIFQNDFYFKNQEYVNLLKTHELDGLIIWGAVNSDSYVAELDGFPVIVANSRPEKIKAINYIGCDNRNGSFELTEYFIRNGYRKFAWLGGTGNSNSIGRDRFGGFIDALEKSALKCIDVLECPFSRSSGEHKLDEYLRSHPVPDWEILCCASDELAFGAYLCCRNHKIRIPEQLILTGADGVGSFPTGLFPLPSYSVPAPELGSLCVHELLKRIEQPNLPGINIQLPVKINIPKEIRSATITQKGV